MAFGQVIRTTYSFAARLWLRQRRGESCPNALRRSRTPSCGIQRNPVKSALAAKSFFSIQPLSRVQIKTLATKEKHEKCWASRKLAFRLTWCKRAFTEMLMISWLSLHVVIWYIFSAGPHTYRWVANSVWPFFRWLRRIHHADFSEVSSTSRYMFRGLLCHSCT